MNEALGQELLLLARRSIAKVVAPDTVAGKPREPDAQVQALLRQPGAVFVTLTIDGDLRGCIGSLQAHRSLALDCQQNAVAAALEDHRFPPLSRVELDLVRIEVSALSPACKLEVRDEMDAYQRLRPGIDGVILSYPGHRATFLPQVWQQLPVPRDFLAALKHKAGLPQDFWSSALSLEIYQVEHVQESLE